MNLDLSTRSQDRIWASLVGQLVFCHIFERPTQRLMISCSKLKLESLTNLERYHHAVL